jgi:hypothetical protein
MTQKSDGRPHRAHSKSKPKFELPVEKNEPEAVAWVHRTAETVAEKPAPKPSPVARATDDDSSTFISLGLALMAASLIVAGQVSLTAFGILIAPVRWGRRLLSI